MNGQANIVLSRTPNPLHYTQGSQRKSLLSWGFFAKPRNVMLKMVIDTVYDNLVFDNTREEIRPENMLVSVVYLTGPLAFARGFDMARLTNDTFKYYMNEPNFGDKCKWKVKDVYQSGEKYSHKNGHILRKALT